MGARYQLPTVAVALMITVGDKQELLPITNRELLTDVAVAALQEAIQDARSETDIIARLVKSEEAVVLAKILRKLIPEVREVLGAPAKAIEVVIQ